MAILQTEDGDFDDEEEMYVKDNQYKILQLLKQIEINTRK